jgi:hypothetical protein
MSGTWSFKKLRPVANKPRRDQKRKRLQLEILEARRVMAYSAGGAATTTADHTYALNLSQTENASQWKINWGDGTGVQVVDASATSVTHLFPYGPSTPVITTELYRADGSFAGFSPKEVSVGSDGVAFGRRDDGVIFRLNGQTWTQLSLNFAGIAVRNSTEVWGFDAAGNVSVWNGTTLTAVPGQLLKKVAVSFDGGVWGINTAGIGVQRVGTTWVSTNYTLYDIGASNGGGAHAVRTDGSLIYFSGTGAQTFGGALTDIATGSGNLVYGVNVHGSVYRLNNWVWTQQTQWPAMRSLTVNTENDIWGIDAKGAVIRWNGTTFTKVPATVTSVTVAGSSASATGATTAVEGQPYVLNLSQTNNASQWKINWGDGTGVQVVESGATSVTHMFPDGPSTPVITTEAYRADGSFAGFAPREISVGSDGVLFAQRHDGAIFRLDGQTWTQLPLNFGGIAVRNSTEIWGFDASGNVSIWNGTTLTAVPGQLLKQVAVSFDGGVWGVNTLGNAVRRVGSTWVSTNLELSDIAASNSGGAHAVRPDGSLVYSTNNVWQSFSGILKDIAAGAGNLVYGVDTLGRVTRWYNPGNWGWYLQTQWPLMKSLTVNTENDIWGIDTTGAVIRWNGTTISKVPAFVSSVAVANQSPTSFVQASAPVMVNEPFTPQIRFSDAGFDQPQYFAINWGDGSPVEVVLATERPSHRYATAGTYNVTTTMFDEDSPLPPATANGAGNVVVEPGRFSWITQVGVSTWNRIPTSQGSPSGVELTAAPLSALGDSTTGAQLDFRVNFAAAGTKYAWIRMRSPQATSSSIHLGLNGVPFSYGGQGVATSSNQWEWVRTVLGGAAGNRLNVATPLGDATINLWSRSGRIEVDQILLTPDANFSPVGRLQETRSLTSSYPAVSTPVVVTPGFQPAIPIPAGSLLPIAAVDEGTMFFGQSKLFPVVNNDFDPDGQSVSLFRQSFSPLRIRPVI